MLLDSLRLPAIRNLWGGQVLSAIGDEIYRVALVWLAVTLAGADAGYLTAVQSAAIFFFGLAGGLFADHWDLRRTMLWSDSLRAVVVMIPPLLACFFPLNITILVIVAVILSAVSAFFDPALAATLPRLVAEEGPQGAEGHQLLHSANSLFDGTRRLARIVGPGLVGMLNPFLPTIHFFTLDALSFVFSALAVRRIPRTGSEPLPAAAKRRLHQALHETLLGAWKLTRHEPLLRYALVAKGVINGSWALGFYLGMALLAHQRFPDNVGAFGAIVAAYGIGNLGSNLAVASRPMHYPGRMLFWGIGVLGTGFVGLALAPSLPWLMVIAALTATGGPMSDIALVTILQHSHGPREIARLFRFRMTVDNGCILATLLFSPWLFRTFSIPTVVAASGIVVLPFAVYGARRFGTVRFA